MKVILYTFFLFFTFNIYSFTVIGIDGYLNSNDLKKIKSVANNNDNELFVYLNTSGGKLSTLFALADEIDKLKKKGVKIYAFADKNSEVYAGGFLILLLSDTVFYYNHMDLGVFTPLDLNKYKKYKEKFDKLFKDMGDYKFIKKIFLQGDMFNPGLTDSYKTKFIKIESIDDIEYSVSSFDKKIIEKSSREFIDLYKPDYIFILFNMAIILTLISVYFSRSIIVKVLSVSLIVFFVFLSFEISIGFKAVIAIFFAHFMLIFKEYAKMKYIISVLSFSIFILSSIYFIEPSQLDYYIDTGFRVSGFTIFLSIVSIIFIYKVFIFIFNRRFKKFNNNQNELKHKEAEVVSLNPLKVSFMGDEFYALSSNKLKVGTVVRVTGFKGLKMIVERV